MNGESPSPGAASAPGLPAAVGRATFDAELERLRAREKAQAVAVTKLVATAIGGVVPEPPAWPAGVPG
jgi:hypothetical protein